MAPALPRLCWLLLAACLATSVVLAQGQRSVTVPPGAREAAPGLYFLGEARDHGRAVEGWAIVHFARGQASRPSSRTDSCYGFLAKGAKWKTVEPYLVNPANSQGLSSSFMTGILADSIGTWEAAAGSQIVGTGASTAQELVADTQQPDGQNEVYFGDVQQAGAIAVTIVWGIFSGPVSRRELVEWDQVYDEADFNWSASGEPDKMDFWNLAMHELGHTMGLADLYQLVCGEATMYGYAAEGEISKRTLASSDIAGIQVLY